ncbi:abortive phage resistance protein [Pseudanabaena sp. lw0831]|uniref:abortive infection family protein n=1 Tax=Pseudanabaena sp. lw0831 TaxID=1357935 RepID=UPI001915ED78|nr:abortive infection family protein [Pseudanabaena sp. lw0831]GBO54227.1 abortive phage resistance protein [Pseudanabaena sp. lw0831]
MTTRLEKVRQLQNILIARATHEDTKDDDYSILRLELLRDSTVRDLLPQFVRTCDELSKFWGFIKSKFSTYQERKNFIWEEFGSLIISLEQNIIAAQPADDDISTILVEFDTEHVHIAWQKALERRDEDPEAAITMARTLLESVCKHILDDASIAYSDKDDLLKLYRETAKQLNMAPEQHQEEVFKQILSGCFSVIHGLGTLRNKLSDAHGKGKKAIKPSPRHTTLAVNLAGSMAAFLVTTWEERVSKST